MAPSKNATGTTVPSISTGAATSIAGNPSLVVTSAIVMGFKVTTPPSSSFRGGVALTRSYVPKSDEPAYSASTVAAAPELEPDALPPELEPVLCPACSAVTSSLLVPTGADAALHATSRAPAGRLRPENTDFQA